MSKLWIDKYRTHKYDPIVIRLSNGSSLRLCVGNGFDGSSGFYFKGPKHGDAPEIIPKDFGLVRKALLWYAKEEMALRQREGRSSTHYYDCLTQRPNKAAPIYEGSGSPYDAVYMAGALTKPEPRICTHKWAQRVNKKLKILPTDECIYCQRVRKHVKSTVPYGGKNTPTPSGTFR